MNTVDLKPENNILVLLKGILKNKNLLMTDVTDFKEDENFINAKVKANPALIKVYEPTLGLYCAVVKSKDLRPA